MKQRSLSLAALLLAGVAQAAVAPSPALASGSVETVSEVDLARYVGRWHELAKIPNRFQKKCASGTTAEYSLRQDGRIAVINRCVRADGGSEEAAGVARVVAGSGNAKLQVSFVSFLGWRPFWGDYWIIGLDADYRWAVIGTPDRKYGWVLAREAEIGGELWQEIFAVLETNGYDIEAFELDES